MKRFVELLVCAALLFCGSASRAQQAVPFGNCQLSQNMQLQVPNIGNTTNWGNCLNYDLTYLDTMLGGVGYIPQGSTSPSVLHYTNWVTSNTLTTTLTSFVNAFPGQQIRLFCSPTDTFTQVLPTASLNLSTAWSCATSKSLSLVLINGIWVESARYGGGGGGGGGGSGTVTTISVGDLSPIFSSSVSNPTIAPVVSFSLTSHNANTVFGNCTALSGSPTFCSITAAMLPVINCASMPGLTGDVSSAQGSCASSVVALRGSTLPALSSGYLHYTGAAWVLDQPSTGSYVSSVGLSMPSWFSVANSPVTGSATLTVTAQTGQTSHQVIGTCGSATSFAPCSLVGGDIPAVNLGASGNGGVTGSLPWGSLSGVPNFYYQTVLANASIQTQRAALNLVAGSNMSVSCVDNSGSNRTDCTLTSSATAATAWSAITASSNSNAGSFSATGNSWSFSGATSFTLPTVGAVFPGASSGSATVAAQSAAGTTTLTLPTSSGTFAVTASSPLTLNSVTGNLTVASATTGALGVVQLAGDLGGTATLPSVLRVNGVAYGGNPGTNTLPVVTSSNTITYEAVPNAALVNSSVTVNGTSNQIASSSSSISLGGATTLSISNPFTFPGKATHAASTTSAASMNVPSGSAPTVPASGDFWNLSGILQFYDGAHTNSLATIQAAPTSGRLAQFSGTAGLLADSGLTGSSIPTSVLNDTNVTGSITSNVLTLAWSGTLASGRLNANVVQAVTNDTNVTGSITAQNLTIGWTGTLASGRLNANVVQAFTNDTNVTASITAQNATLAWSGQLAVSRGGSGAATLSAHGVLLGEGTSAITASTPTGNSQCFMSAASNYATTDPSFQSCPLANSGAQYALGIYSTAGTTLSGLTPPSTNGTWILTSVVSGGTAVQPSWALPGVTVDATNPSTLLYTDRNSYLPWTSGSTLTLPAASGNFASNFVFVLQNTSGGAVAVTPTTPNNIDGGTSQAASSVANGWAAFVYQDSTPNWFTIKFPTANALQGTDAKILSAGTISGTAANLCTDANGGATTSGCSSGSITGSGTATRVAVWSGSSSLTGYAGLTTDSSGNVTATSVSTGSITTTGSTAGFIQLGQGTANSAGTTAVTLQAPTSVTSYLITFPGAIGSSNQVLQIASISGSTATMQWASPGTGTVTSVGITPPSWLTASASITTSGSITLTPTAAQTSHQVIGTCGTNTTFAPCSLVAGDLPAALSSQTSINGLSITASTGTLTVAAAKTVTFNNILTFSGTDSTTMTFPSTSASVARIDAAQSFAGAQTFSANGAASTPAMTLSGAPYTGGSGTTTYPLLYLNNGSAPSTWSTSGTELGFNAPSGFSGNFFDAHVNGGASVASLSSTGAFVALTHNGLTLTSLTTGFSVAGGTTSKTLTVSNTLTLAGTDSTTITFPGTSQTVPGLGQANTWTTGLQTFTAATLSLPASAAYAPTTAGLFGYDTTNNRLVVGNGTNTSIPVWITSAGSYTTGHVMVFSGTLGAVADGGAAGTGTVTSSSLTQYQLAVATTTTNISGITCGAGMLLQGASSANPACTVTPTLGVQNTSAGSLTVAGGSSATGTVILNIAGATANGTTLQPGANTGAVTITLPNATGTLALLASPSFTTPSLGAATATSLIASGIVDGLAPVTLTTVTSCTLGTASGCNATAYNSGYTFNQYATAATEVTYTLPTAAVGKQFCVANDAGSGGANTGILRVNTSASGQHVRFKGTIGATGGYIRSGGAAGDAGCFVGISTTDWIFYPQSGAWTQDSGG